MKKKLLWCMTALTALLSVSCTSELALEGASSPNNVLTDEEVEVTFSVSAQGPQMQTRVGGPGRYQNKVGKGTEIDMLIYAVYEKDDDTGEYTLLKQYGKGIVGEDYTDDSHAPFAADSKAIEAKKNPNGNDNDDNGSNSEKPYAGQTILNLGEKFKNNEDATEVITLRLMRNKTYHIAFWAQSSKTDAFKTNDLTNVQVIYENAENNDELRDAFCKVESFSVSPSTTARTVILTRPMAQINVGTSGADYKHLLNSVWVYPNDAVTLSKIRLTGVSNTINVVTDQILAPTSGQDVATFDWSPLAAYIKNNGEIPATEETLLKVKDEEFLRVDLNHDGTIYRYKTNYPTLDVKGNFLTETFKYLSMCYALVPAPVAFTDTETSGDTGDDDGDGDGDEEEDKDYQLPDPYSSTVLNKVEVFLAGEKTKAQVDANETATMTLTNVPVHRNWRTNIIGGLYYMDDPDPDPDDPDDPGYPDDDDPDDPKEDDDPDDPTPVEPGPDDPEPGDTDDPTSVFNYKTTRIYLDNMFYNEHNGYRGEYDKDDDSYDYDKQPKDEVPEDSQEPEDGDDEVQGEETE